MEEGEEYIVDTYVNGRNKQLATYPTVVYQYGEYYKAIDTYQKTRSFFTYRSYEDVFMSSSPDNKMNLIEDDGEYDEE